MIGTKFLNLPIVRLFLITHGKSLDFTDCRKVEDFVAEFLKIENPYQQKILLAFCTFRQEYNGAAKVRKIIDANNFTFEVAVAPSATPSVEEILKC